MNVLNSYIVLKILFSFFYVKLHVLYSKCVAVGETIMICDS